MLILEGIAGKSCIVGMLAKEKQVKVISYNEDVLEVPDAIIYNTDSFDEFLQGVEFELARESGSQKPLKQYLILYTNAHKSIILRRTEYIKKIEDLYGIQLVITCKPNEGYGGVSSGYTVNSAR